MNRVEWHDLPTLLQKAVAERTGQVHNARTVAGGLNSALAAVLDTDDGQVFVKGIPTDHRGVVAQAREKVVNTAVRPIAPVVLWHLPDVAGWNVLGFEFIDGRTADYTRGSADLAPIAATMDALARLPCPDVPLKDATRWRSYADDGDTTPFEGNTLLHTDWKPDNVLVQPAAVRVVDWSWPTRGAAWIDPACLLIQLIANGHTPAEADGWAAGTHAWREAPPAAVDAFSRANVRLWDEIADANPTPWHRRTADAAHAWATSRID